MTKTIDDMKAELLDAGYNLHFSELWDDRTFIQSPDGVLFPYTFFDDSVTVATTLAYRHLQERRELEALRKYVLEAHGVAKKIKEVKLDRDSPLVDMVLIVNRSWAYIEWFNITADESESDET